MYGPEEIESRAHEASEFLKDRFEALPSAAVVLGTGWGGLTDGYDVASRVEFHDIPGFRRVTAPDHVGCISLVETSAGPLIVQDGRFHCYEGYSSLETTYPIWVYKALGVKTIVLLSAAGGLNPTYLPGDLIVLRDHIFIWGSNPLIGVPANDERGRYIINAQFYPERWQDVLRTSVPPDARCETGVYAFMTGPSFETDAEASLLRIAGADAVGMSTAPEAIVARYLGMDVGAMCCISNTLLPFRAGGDREESLVGVVRSAAESLDGFLDRIVASADVIG